MVGCAFDGKRVHLLGLNLNHYVVNRQNFAALANAVAVFTPVKTGAANRGLTFDGKQFWFFDREAVNTNLRCYKLDGAVAAPPSLRIIVLAGIVWLGLAFDGKYLLLGNSATTSINWLDIDSGTIVDSWNIGFAPSDLTFDGKYIWTTDGTNNLVHCFNPRARVEVTSFAFPPGPDSWPAGITFDGKYLWIGTYPNANGILYCVEKS